MGRAPLDLLQLLCRQFGPVAKFARIPPRSILFKKVIKHQKRLSLAVPCLSDTQLARSMMFARIPPRSVVLQKAMHGSEYNDKVAPVFVSSPDCTSFGGQQTHVRSICASGEHSFLSLRVGRSGT